MLSAQPRPQVQWVGGKRLRLGSAPPEELHRAHRIWVGSRPGISVVRHIRRHSPFQNLSRHCNFIPGSGCSLRSPLETELQVAWPKSSRLGTWDVTLFPPGLIEKQTGKWMGPNVFKIYCSLPSIITSHGLLAEELVSYLICLFFPSLLIILS